MEWVFSFFGWIWGKWRAGWFKVEVNGNEYHTVMGVHLTTGLKFDVLKGIPL